MRCTLSGEKRRNAVIEHAFRGAVNVFGRSRGRADGAIL
jgi:hypothetical protein